MTLWGLYIVYYLVFPLAVLLPIFLTWKNKELIKGVSIFSFGREESSSGVLREKVSSMKNLQVVLVVAILLFVPVMNFTTSAIQDRVIQRDFGTGEGLGRGAEYNPVPDWGKVGPSYDTDAVIEEMEEYPDRWRLENLREKIDFEEITRMPGRLTVYYQEKLDWDYIIITYTYLSPLPITRLYGFRVIEDVVALREMETIMYPMDPSRVDPF